MRYIGDISRRDSELLCRYAKSSERILEFGSGASTQVLARCSARSATIVSIETDARWMERTRRNLALLGIDRPVSFIPFRHWRDRVASSDPFDLIFDDGIDRRRRRFAEEAWPLLRIGGHLLFHDTRRRKDMKNVLEIVGRYFLEIDSIQLNEASSNITVLKKKVAEPWEDWNIVEGRQRWEYGHAEAPEGLWEDESS